MSSKGFDPHGIFPKPTTVGAVHAEAGSGGSSSVNTSIGLPDVRRVLVAFGPNVHEWQGIRATELHMQDDGKTLKLFLKSRDDLRGEER